MAITTSPKKLLLLLGDVNVRHSLTNFTPSESYPNYRVKCDDCGFEKVVDNGTYPLNTLQALRLIEEEVYSSLYHPTTCTLSFCFKVVSRLTFSISFSKSFRKSRIAFIYVGFEKQFWTYPLFLYTLPTCLSLSFRLLQF